MTHIEMDVFQWLGFAGMLCIVLAYFLLQIGKYDIHSLSYQLLNLSGAIALIISLAVHFNLGSFLIEIFWIVITLYGMVKNLRKKMAKRTKMVKNT
jgi:predicted membrane protein